MAINFSNVNISLQQFQDIASGTYNAGEVALKSESKLVKINNHVYRLGANTKAISHAEVLAIKNAFVKALSDNGVDKSEINAIRKELGLMPDETAPKSLAERSIKPLSRQQIREIIDRNIGAINASRAERGQKAFKDSTRLYGTDKAKLESLAGKRNDAAGSLNRTQTESEEIANFQKIISGDIAGIDIEKAYELDLQDTILAQKDAILAKSKGNPKSQGDCVLEFETENGHKCLLSSGKSERDTIKMLDEAYILLNGGTNLARRNATIARMITDQNKDRIPFDFREMIKSVRAEATGLFGKEAVEQRENRLDNLVKGYDITSSAEAMAEKGIALTPDNFREVFRKSCIMQSARNLVKNKIDAVMQGLGEKASIGTSIQATLLKSMPEVFKALANAKTKKEVDGIIESAMPKIREATTRGVLANKEHKQLENYMNEAFAAEMGVKWKGGDAEIASFGILAGTRGNDLFEAIVGGRNKAGTPEEIASEFKNLAAETAHERAKILRDADALGLSGDAADRVKQHLTAINGIKRLDLAKVASLAKDIDVKPLADAFAQNAPMAKIFEEIAKLRAAAVGKVPVLFKGASEIGADEDAKGTPLLLFMALDKSPGLAARLEAFLLNGDVQNALNAENAELPNGLFDVNVYMTAGKTPPAEIAPTIGKPDMKPLFAQALMKAVDGIGLENLAPDEKLALFADGTAAGRIVREALNALPPGMPLKPNMLYGIALGAARGIDAGEVNARHDA